MRAIAIPDAMLHRDIRLVIILIVADIPLLFGLLFILSFLFLGFALDLRQHGPAFNKKVLVVFAEAFVAEVALIVGLANFVEIIHVELH